MKEWQYKVLSLMLGLTLAASMIATAGRASAYMVSGTAEADTRPCVVIDAGHGGGKQRQCVVIGKQENRIAVGRERTYQFMVCGSLFICFVVCSCSQTDDSC